MKNKIDDVTFTRKNRSWLFWNEFDRHDYFSQRTFSEWSTSKFHGSMRDTHSKPELSTRDLHEDESTEEDSWIRSELKSWKLKDNIWNTKHISGRNLSSETMQREGFRERN